MKHKKLILAAIVTSCVAGYLTTLLALGLPTLSVALTPAKTITVKNVNPQAIGACTIFLSLDDHLDDGSPYAPRHCWFFDNDGTAGINYQYQDDWGYIPMGHTYDVSAEVYTDGPDGPTTETSNTVRVGNY